MTQCYFSPDTSGSQPLVSARSKNEGDLVNQVGLGRKQILAAVQASVERLGTYIDVLQIHRLDRDVEPREVMRALNEVVEKGWVRYIGASSMACWEFHKQLEASVDSEGERLARVRQHAALSQLALP